MKFIKNKTNKFHIGDSVAEGILKDVLLRNDQHYEEMPDVLPDRFIGILNEEKSPGSLGIKIALSMLVLTALLPVMLIAPDVKIDFRQITEVAGTSDKKAQAINFDTSGLEKGSRDNKPDCLVPERGTSAFFSNDVASIDASNASEGYVIVHYTGESDKVKLQITGPTDITYTYNLATGGGKDEVFPLPEGDGKYLICIYENLTGTQYLTAFTKSIKVTLRDQFLPFLYPNQYVDFKKDDTAIKYAEYLSYTANSDLDVVSAIYNDLISTMSYDYEEAQSVESGYIPDIDEVLDTRTGICLDYAVLMSAMLRSQSIPTRMEVGYAGTAYHAWISTYIKDIGWVNGIIQFDGKDWSLMDPTFASTTDTDKLASFIGDGENYKTKYVY
ncbi:transglutaminase-like domain-containing protein [Butyrivibrio sp. NC2002]|uniref:transglutaminase-like domain-containing protein n=1 Tax=Butyrivibrio sp. NC2002 TaxID=1410610 RepID=UPI000A51CAF2|nr:transglutaminase-like domain-containing protein [Butyrivibrio sp. NC2002]